MANYLESLMIKIAILAGSTRAGSYNQTLASLAASSAAAYGAESVLVDLRDFHLPIYSQEVEDEGLPDGALTLKQLLQAHDGMIIASPEHNGSVSSLLKNAIDWASRPTESESPTALSAYRNKPVAIMSASTGPFGGLRSLAHLRQILGTIQMLVIPEQVAVPFADRAFAEDGSLKEPLPASLLDTMTKRLIDLAGMLATRD